MREQTLRLAVFICTILSTLGSLFIIISYALFKNLRRLPYSFIFYLSISDLLISVSIFIANIDREESCTISGIAVTYAYTASDLWTAAVSYLIYSIIVMDATRDLTIRLPLFHALCWGVPLLFTIPAVVVFKFHRTSFGWCWIPHADYVTRLLSRYIIGSLVLVFNVAILIATYITILRRQMKLKQQLDEPMSDATPRNSFSSSIHSSSPSPHFKQPLLSQFNADVLLSSKIDTYRILLRLTVFVATSVVIHVIGSVDRHRHFIRQDSPDAIMFMHGLLDSSRGFIHALVYGTTSQLLGAHRHMLSRRVDSANNGVLSMT